MPGPLINDDVTPSWLKPSNASVFDPAYRAPIRALVHALGWDDPQQMMGVAAPLLTLTPRVPAAQLIERLAPTNSAPPEIRSAVEYLVQRFPRLMSHVSAVEGRPLTAQAATNDLLPEGRVLRGRFIPSRLAVDPGAAWRLDDQTIGALQYDHTHVGNAVETLTHEATHAAQALKETDRFMRGSSRTAFDQIYAGMNDRFGYQQNPFEVAARRNADNEVARAAR